MEDFVKNAPNSPGVYLIKDKETQVIYVGKAANIRKRIRNYFPKKGTESIDDPKTRILVSHATSIEFIKTPNESEAILLEARLIRLHKPRYNISLKDDKRYPYIRVSLEEEFPRILLARRAESKSGSAYFGPHASGGLARSTIRLVKQVFGLRSCKGRLPARACLDYHIGTCSAPCTGKISKDSYLKNVERTCELLEGGLATRTAVGILEKRMKEFSQTEKFEKAATIRDALKGISERSRLARVQDYVSISASSGGGRGRKIVYAAGVVSVDRDRPSGRSMNESFLISVPGNPKNRETAVLAAFIKQRYVSSGIRDRLILVRERIPDMDLLRVALARSGNLRLKLATTPRERRLIELSDQTAKLRLSTEIAGSRRALPDLSVIGIVDTPGRIEGLDVSGFAGRELVGSVVVFEDGFPKKSEYRKFRMKQVPQGRMNDVACLAEIARRRYSKLRAKNTPDLIVVDGGRAQLNAVLRELERAGLFSVKIVSLAKRLEEVYLPGLKKPIRLPKSSPQLQLLQRVRDEAHRFAVAYHRKLRQKKALESVLDNIPGIGPATRRLVHSKFESTADIARSGIRGLMEIPGIGKKTAERIIRFLKQPSIE